MTNPLVKIIAKNPPSILLALGGLGYLAKVDGSGLLLALGVLLNLAWLGVKMV